MYNGFKTHKEAYLYGFKDGLTIGIEKGMELAGDWTCPTSNTANTMSATMESLPSPVPHEGDHP